MKRTLAALGAAAVVLGSASAAFAITNGTPDGDGHPYVGLMVAQDADGNPLWRCTGTLISSTLFLTAGHCTEDPAAHVEIWFDADVESGRPGNGYPLDGEVGGTPYTHPLYDPDNFSSHDLGVVVLDEPMAMDSYGALPEEGAVNAYVTAAGKKGATFTAVGYGLQKAFPDAAAWKEVALRVRMVSHPRLIQIDRGIVGDASLLLTNNAKTGGTCFGDSGGPNFIGDSNVVGGVTSFGLNPACGGTGGVYRVDMADDLDWLATFGA